MSKRQNRPLSSSGGIQDILGRNDFGRKPSQRPGSPSIISSASPEAKRARLSLKMPKVELKILSESTHSKPVATERARRQALAAECVDASLASSAKRTYESALNVTVRGAEKAVGAEFLPVDPDEKIMTIISDMVGAPWGSIRLNLSALRAWRMARGMENVFESAWAERAKAFWSGLKRLADHTVSAAKRPLSAEEFSIYIERRLSSPTIAGERDAAVAAICFFGVRRISEALALRRRDVSTSDDAATVHISRQKNDPNGKGMKAFIPGIPRWGRLCPKALVSSWLHRWHAVAGSRGAELPLFFLLGKDDLAPLTYDVFRRSLKTLGDKGLGTHSLRKGGASWHKHVAKAPEKATQAQGGWAQKDCMEKCYLTVSETARKDALVRCAGKTSKGGPGKA